MNLTRIQLFVREVVKDKPNYCEPILQKFEKFYSKIQPKPLRALPLFRTFEHEELKHSGCINLLIAYEDYCAKQEGRISDNTLYHLRNFVLETYTDNHAWAKQVLHKWEQKKAQLQTENPNLLLCDPLYKEFSDQYGNKMFVLSMLRGYEAYLANVKIAMN